MTTPKNVQENLSKLKSGIPAEVMDLFRSKLRDDEIDEMLLWFVNYVTLIKPENNFEVFQAYFGGYIKSRDNLKNKRIVSNAIG